MTDIVAHTRQVLDAHALRDRSVCVGLSGGLDSVVLLHVMAGLAKPLGLRLSAVHVNHGLHPRAAQWAAFCTGLCRGLDVPLSVAQVTVDRSSGLGIEAAARAQRYGVYAGLEADCLVLAHHLDDQAETFLLQLLRGAGAKGLGAMPFARRLGAAGPELVRPFLTLTRAQLARYAESHALDWIEDESNAELDFDRNFLRHKVLPAIAERFPAYRSTLSRSIRNLADAAELGEILGRQDLAAVRTGNAIALDRVRSWPESRMLNVLRSLFSELGHAPPRRAVLCEALRQAFAARRDAQVQVEAGDVSLRRHRGNLYLVRNVEPPAGWQAQWHGEARLALPEGLGELHFRPATGAGLSVRKLQQAPVNVVFRRGGERMSLAVNRPHRCLRKLYQEANVAPWLRQRTPLLLCGERLAFVPGLGAAAEFQAGPEEAAWTVEWVTG